MITLTAKIDILPAEDSNLALNSTEPSKNRISNYLSEVFGKKINYDKPFFLGSSNFGDGDKFTDETETKKYFISNNISNEFGTFDNSTSFNISDDTQQMTSITIAFDTENNRHPNKITVDGIEYADDDAIFTVTNLEPKSVHTVKINDWNVPNSPLVITGIYSNISIEIDRRNLISLETSLYDRSDLKLPSFGIISNHGNIEFNDFSGEVRDYAEQHLLQSGLKCDIILKNTLVENAKKTVAVFETDQWNYDNEKKTVSVSLKDDLEKWQDITVEAINYVAQNPVEKNLYWFFHELSIITMNNGYVMQETVSGLDAKTLEVLETTIIKYPLLYSGSLWESWQKVCEVGQLHIYQENGVVKFRYNGGN